jgi:hypothetical protein
MESVKPSLLQLLVPVQYVSRLVKVRLVYARNYLYPIHK